MAPEHKKQSMNRESWKQSWKMSYENTNQGSAPGAGQLFLLETLTTSLFQIAKNSSGSASRLSFSSCTSSLWARLSSTVLSEHMFTDLNPSLNRNNRAFRSTWQAEASELLAANFTAANNADSVAVSQSGLLFDFLKNVRNPPNRCESRQTRYSSFLF